MSVSVYIDGQPAERYEEYVEVLRNLGVVPDESENHFELWTTEPGAPVTSRSVWLNSSSDTTSD